MLYEIQITRGDGTLAKEPFTAANDKKVIQRVESTLERHTRQSAGRTYKLLDVRGREVIRETAIPKTD